MVKPGKMWESYEYRPETMRRTVGPVGHKFTILYPKGWAVEKDEKVLPKNMGVAGETTGYVLGRWVSPSGTSRLTVQITLVELESEITLEEWAKLCENESKEFFSGLSPTKRERWLSYSSSEHIDYYANYRKLEHYSTRIGGESAVVHLFLGDISRLTRSSERARTRISQAFPFLEQSSTWQPLDTTVRSAKFKEVYILRQHSGYIILCMAMPEDEFEMADKDYFEPILESFRFHRKE